MRWDRNGQQFQMIEDCSSAHHHHPTVLAFSFPFFGVGSFWLFLILCLSPTHTDVPTNVYIFLLFWQVFIWSVCYFYLSIELFCGSPDHQARQTAIKMSSSRSFAFISRVIVISLNLDWDVWVPLIYYSYRNSCCVCSNNSLLLLLFRFFGVDYAH